VSPTTQRCRDQPVFKAFIALSVGKLKVDE
jgi:hypothetical protein